MWRLESKAQASVNYLRAATPNEIRCVARESLGFYSSLVVGGIYEFVKPTDTKSIITYTHALKKCIATHPRLSTLISNHDTDSPYFEFCPRMDLSQHFQLLEREGRDGETEIMAIQERLPTLVDEFPTTTIPLWKIVVLPFSKNRIFVALSYSHALGDGLSGTAFHRTFLEAIQEQHLDHDLIYLPTRQPFDRPFDTPKNLPISWAYLLSPLLGQYLPKWLSASFGFSNELNATTTSTWTGTPIFYNKDNHHTGVDLISIDGETVETSLKLCRMNGAKLTGLLHQLILDAITDSLPKPHKFDSFGAGTAINMRPTAGVSNDQMGNFASGDFNMIPLQGNVWDGKGQSSWKLAKSITERLAGMAKDPRDHPLGLLRYLWSVRSWTLSKIGERREDSWTISNLMSFQPLGTVERCAVKEMIFCRPADVAGGAALSFNVVSLRGGRMNITISWQAEGLDLGTYQDEVAFVRTVCQHIEASFARLCKTKGVLEKS